MQHKTTHLFVIMTFTLTQLYFTQAQTVICRSSYSVIDKQNTDARTWSMLIQSGNSFLYYENANLGNLGPPFCCCPSEEASDSTSMCLCKMFSMGGSLKCSRSWSKLSWCRKYMCLCKWHGLPDCWLQYWHVNTISSLLTLPIFHSNDYKSALGTKCRHML